MRISALLRRLHRRRRALGVALALGATLAAARAGAQRGFFRNNIEPNAEYDGQFTFVRLRYTGWSGRWIADYPAMERNFMTILNDLTTVHPRVGQSNILTMDDPELSRYAVAYVCEPGFWTPTDGEAAALRACPRRGEGGHERERNTQHSPPMDAAEQGRRHDAARRATSPAARRRAIDSTPRPPHDTPPEPVSECPASDRSAVRRRACAPARTRSP